MLTIEDVRKVLETNNRVALVCVDRDGFINSDNGKYKKENEEILSSDLIAFIPDWNTRRIKILDCDYALCIDEFKYFRIKGNSTTFDDLLNEAYKGMDDRVINSLKITRGDTQRGLIINEHKQFIEETAHEGIDFIKSLYINTDPFDELNDDVESFYDPAHTYEETFDDLIDVAVQAYKDGLIIIEKMNVNLDYTIIECGKGGGVVPRNIDSPEFNVYKYHIEKIKSLYIDTFVIENVDDIEKVVEGDEIELSNGIVITAMKRSLSQYCVIYRKDNYHPCERLWFESLKGATVTRNRVKE